jgi:hypothetical protein
MNTQDGTLHVLPPVSDSDLQAAPVAPKKTRSSKPRVRVSKRASKKPVVEVEPDTGVLAEARAAWGQHPIRAIVGALIGAWVPFSAYRLAHYEVKWEESLMSQPAFLFVIGALCFSIPTVYAWTRQAFGSAFKAFGFVILTEGIMCYSMTGWLSVLGLAYLILMNACSASVSFAKPKTHQIPGL